MILGGKKGFLTCNGTIEQFGIWGPYVYWRIRVSYVVNSTRYEIVESVKLRSKVIKLGPIPIGQKRTPKLPTTKIGDTVAVCYDPKDPSRAYLRDNEGFATSG